MLNLRQIEAFRAVIETGTVSRAAKRLSISQPAVSKLIQNLEGSTGVVLFERAPGRIVPTAEALLLFEEVERIFKGLSSLEAFVGDIRALHRSSLRIGVMPALSIGFIQDILVHFTAAHPATRVSVHARSTAKIVEWLVAGHLDAGMSSHPITHPEVLQIALCRRPYVCAMPRGHPLARRAAVRPEDLANESFISFAPESDMRQAIDQLFDSAGVERKMLMEASMAPTVCALVARGIGVSVLNPLYVGAFSGQVTLRPLSPTVHSEVKILLPRHRNQSLVTKSFVDLAQAYAASTAATP